MLLEGIVLKSCAQIQGERKIQSIFHILKGKKSIQILQDIYLFQIEHFYSLYPSLMMNDFNECVELLIRNHWLKKVKKEDTYRITKMGKEQLEVFNKTIPFSSYKGFQYHKMDEIFYERILLLIQIISNRSADHNEYIPITDDLETLRWMRQFYQQLKKDWHSTIDTIYDELQNILQSLLTLEAEMFVDRLTGYNNYGMSLQQLSHKYGRKETDIYLLFKKIIHKMLTEILSHPNRFRWLHQILKDLIEQKPLTQSAMVTYKFLQRGFTLEEIAKRRSLKLNTIYDHVVEIALHDQNFSIDPYVTKKDQQNITKAYKRAKSTRLKAIKDQLEDEDISYFKIRLTLAVITNRMGGIVEE